MYVAFGLVMPALVAIAHRVPVLARFDDEVPDDLMGAQTLRDRSLA